VVNRDRYPDILDTYTTMKKDSAITPLHDVLSSLFQTLGAGDRTELWKVGTLWNDTVGPLIAESTRPAAVRNDVLFVNVATSVWMQELHFMRDTILEKLNRGMEKSTLREIRFRVGPVSSRSGSAPAVQLPGLSSDEEKKIDLDSSSIGDPELRRSFRGVMGAYLKNKKTP